MKSPESMLKILNIYMLLNEIGLINLEITLLFVYVLLIIIKTQ